MTLENPSKITSTLDATTAATKQNVGKIIGNTRMEAEGATERAKANAEYKAAQNLEYKEGTKDRVTGMGQELKGKVTGDDSKRLEGKANQQAGNAQQEASKY